MFFQYAGTPMSALMQCGLVGAFSTLGFYGIYLVVFLLAACMSYHSGYPGRTRTRIPLFLSFVVATLCLVLRIVLFCMNVAGLDQLYDDQFQRRIFNMAITLNFLTCLAGLLSDAVLAWRAFILYGRSPWMKWLLVAAVASDFAGGSLANIGYAKAINQFPVHLQGVTEVDVHFASVKQGNRLIVIWAWRLETVYGKSPTVLTFSIIYKIARQSRWADPVYAKIAHAVIESSAISWLGLLAYGISGAISFNASDSPQQPGTIAFAILPMIFGISQSLIIARMGLSHYRRAHSSAPNSATPGAHNSRAHHRAPTSTPSGLMFADDVDADDQTKLEIIELSGRDV